MSQVQVWCLLIDHEKKAAYGNASRVKISADADINDLTEKIKEKRQDVLENVVPERLTVWRCDEIEFSRIAPDRRNQKLDEVFSTEKAEWVEPDRTVEQYSGKTLLIEVSAAHPLTKRRRLGDKLESLSTDSPWYKLWESAWGSSHWAFEEAGSLVEVLDGDILPDKPFLETINQERILVRAEYRRIYGFVETRCKEADKMRNAPAVVITGHPGIGKTCWLYYALHRRLAEKHPTILYHLDQFHLFSDSGVDKVLDPDSVFMSRPTIEERWCFVDSAEAPERPPIALTGIQNQATNIIYITSPNKRRWRSLRQTRDTYVVFMNPWTLEEVECVVNDRNGPVDGEIKKARERFEAYGPSARICLHFNDYQIKEYDSGLRSAVNAITRMAETMETVIQDVENLRIEGVEAGLEQAGDLSSKICLLRRDLVEPVTFKTRLTIVSKYVIDLCADRLLVLDRNEILKTWNVFSKHPDAHGMTGHVYEAFTHKTLRTRIALNLESMFQHHQGRYHASFTNFANHQGLKRSLEACRKNIHRMTLEFTPLISTAFQEDVQGFHVDPDVYYIPVKKNQVGIDSFIVHDDILYFFQMTVASNHDINPSFLDFPAKLRNIPNAEKWRFVFVFPDVLRDFSCSKPSGNAGSLYTARFSALR